MTLVNNCKFQVYSSMTSHLYIASCGHQPKPSLPLSPYIWLPLLSSFSTPPFSFCCLCLWVCFVHLLLFCIPHMTEISWFLSFSTWLTLLGLVLSRSTHGVANVSFSSLSPCFLVIYGSIHCEEFWRQRRSGFSCLFFCPPPSLPSWSEVPELWILAHPICSSAYWPQLPRVLLEKPHQLLLTVAPLLGLSFILVGSCFMGAKGRGSVCCDGGSGRYVTDLAGTYLLHLQAHGDWVPTVYLHMYTMSKELKARFPVRFFRKWNAVTVLLSSGPQCGLHLCGH